MANAINQPSKAASTSEDMYILYVLLNVYMVRYN
jgi:hypothetical protein